MIIGHLPGGSPQFAIFAFGNAHRYCLVSAATLMRMILSG